MNKNFTFIRLGQTSKTPRSRSPVPSPSRFGCATARYVDHPQAAMGSRHRPGTAPSPVGDRPPLRAPAGDPTPITQVKVYVLGRNRESRSRPGNCDSCPGNAISRELTSLIVIWNILDKIPLCCDSRYHCTGNFFQFKPV